MRLCKEGRSRVAGLGLQRLTRRAVSRVAVGGYAAAGATSCTSSPPPVPKRAAPEKRCPCQNPDGGLKEYLSSRPGKAVRRSSCSPRRVPPPLFRFPSSSFFPFPMLASPAGLVMPCRESMVRELTNRPVVEGEREKTRATTQQAQPGLSGSILRIMQIV